MKEIQSILIILLISVVTINTQCEMKCRTRNLTHTKIAAHYSQNDLSGINVAIFESYLASRVTNSITALTNMFEWMNATVTILNATEIANGCLWNHDILAIPEGLGPYHQSWLRPEGLEAIRQWVSLGGSYIGVRGSAAMAVTKSYFERRNSTFELGLFNGLPVTRTLIISHL